MTNNVSVKLSSGRTTRFSIDGAATTAGQLCARIADEEKASADVITLKFDGKVLKRSKRLVLDYGVMEEMVLKVKLLTKKALQIHLNLPDKEVVTVGIHNTSQLSEISEKLLEAKPLLRARIIHFQIGQMKLDLSNYAYEDCLEDGEQIQVNVKSLPGEEPEEEMEEEDRQEVLNSFASSMTSERKVDIVFSFDNTGSMYSLLATVKQKLRETITKLMTDIPNIQIGIMAHGDYCDQRYYVLRKHDLSADVADLVNFVDATDRSGGEGSFACYEWILRHANRLSWREDSAKALVIIGDVVPHPKSYTDQAVDWREELEQLCAKEVKVYGVQALDHRPADSFYGYMARRSGGAHIKFTHFSLITDMFIAVCYRESGDTQLQAYVDEVKNEGRMTEEMMDVMKQLEKKPEEEEEEKEKDGEEDKKEEAGAEGGASAMADESPSNGSRQREEAYVQEAWWDPTLDLHSQQKFTYSETIDVWTRQNSYSHVPQNQGSQSTRRKFKLKTKKGCALM